MLAGSSCGRWERGFHWPLPCWGETALAVLGVGVDVGDDPGVGGETALAVLGVGVDGGDEPGTWRGGMGIRLA